MPKSALLAAIRDEMRRHDLSHFMDEKNRVVQPAVQPAERRSTPSASLSTT
jgi:hypothetical protein